ncbi:MAG: hypothetical protein ABI237_07180 [Ginsengibacter sp.]
MRLYPPALKANGAAVLLSVIGLVAVSYLLASKKRRKKKIVE